MRMAPFAHCFVALRFSACLMISFSPSAQSGEARSGAELTAEHTDTQIDSTIPELAGIVVLCNQQDYEQNACQPADNSTADSQADRSAREEERAGQRAIRRENRACRRTWQ